MNTARAAFDKVKANIAELGWLNALLHGLDRLLSRMTPALRIHRYYFVAQPVPMKALLAPGRGSSIAVRRMEAGDRVIGTMPIEPRTIADRFRDGALCFGAFRQETMIGCLWMCFDGYFEEEVGSRFVPWPAGRAAWDFDLYIVPTHRLGFAFARLWDSAYECLRQRGYQWTMSRISAFNAVSLNSHAKLGAVRCGSLLVLRCGALRLSLATMAPYIHLAYGVRSSPEYRIPVPATVPGSAGRSFANASLTN